MTETEHLLTCLAEEAAEVQHAICKALRFGLDDANPATGVSNVDQIMAELHDFVAVADMLIEREILPELECHDLALILDAKKTKVEAYIEYAKKRGSLSSELPKCPQP